MAEAVQAKLWNPDVAVSSECQRLCIGAVMDQKGAGLDAIDVEAADFILARRCRELVEVDLAVSSSRNALRTYAVDAEVGDRA